MDVAFCETPGQSAVVGVATGLLAGGVGVASTLEPAAVVALAAGLALVGETAGHLLRGDRQFRAAVERVRR